MVLYATVAFPSDPLTRRTFAVAVAGPCCEYSTWYVGSSNMNSPGSEEELKEYAKFTGTYNISSPIFDLSHDLLSECPK